MSEDHALVPLERIERTILLIRGQKVMLDSDLAAIYQVTTKVLNQAVKRNRERFPVDFMFQLTEDEAGRLRSQIVTSNIGRGGRRYLPYAFTEHGAVMLATVLNSPVAIRASVQVVRAFVRLREILAGHKELARKVEELEKKYDGQFRVVFEAIRQLMAPEEAPPEPEKKMGFHVKEGAVRYGRKRR